MYLSIVLERKEILNRESLTLIMSENVSSETEEIFIFKQNEGEISVSRLCLNDSH